MLIDAKMTELSSGIRVVTASMPRVESVSVGIWVGVGGRHEPAAVSGMSHFIEHLLFKGTKKMSAGDISRAVEGCGGYLNAFTQEEMTCYYARVAYDHTWKVFGVLCDMILNPRLAEADIEKERNVIIEEIMMYRDHPEQMVQEMLGGILWKNHKLSRPLTGSPASLRRIAREDIISFKRRHYVGRNTVFMFAGRVRHDEAVSRVKSMMRGYSSSPPPRAQPVTGKVPQERMMLKSKEIEQAQLAAGFRIFGLPDRRRYALKLLNVILGENMSSRLFQVVREKYGLAYSVQSGSQLFADTGSLVITAGLDRERRRRALDLIAGEVRRLKQDAVRQRELARAIEYVVGHIRLGVESPSGQMMWVGSNMLNYGSPIPAEEVIEAIRCIRPDDIQTLACEIFRPGLASVALLSPGLGVRDEDHVRSMIASL